MREFTNPPTVIEKFTYQWKDWIYSFFQTVKDWGIINASTSGDAPFYEEEPWTPVLTDGTNSDATYSIQEGFYTKIGDRVLFDGRIVISSLGTISGNLFIEGLPYNSASGGLNVVGGMSITRAAGLAITSGTSVCGYVNGNSDRIVLQNFDATTGTTALQASEFSATGDILFHGAYFL